MRSLAKRVAYFAEKSHIIWDWNGTLLDDVSLCRDIIAGLMQEYGMAPISVEEYRRAFRFPVRDYYRDVGFDLEKVSFEELSRQFIQRYNAAVDNVPLYTGARELLLGFSLSGIKHAVLSAAHEADLNRLLAHHGIAECFTHVFGLTDHYAHTKMHRGRELVVALDVPLSQLILIGDTDHDLEVATALGIDCLLVDKGHQCDERLAALTSRLVCRSE